MSYDASKVAEVLGMTAQQISPYSPCPTVPGSEQEFSCEEGDKSFDVTDSSKSTSYSNLFGNTPERATVRISSAPDRHTAATYPVQRRTFGSVLGSGLVPTPAPRTSYPTAPTERQGHNSYSKVHADRDSTLLEMLGVNSSRTRSESVAEGLRLLRDLNASDSDADVSSLSSSPLSASASPLSDTSSSSSSDPERHRPASKHRNLASHKKTSNRRRRKASTSHMRSRRDHRDERRHQDKLRGEYEEIVRQLAYENMLASYGYTQMPYEAQGGHHLSYITAEVAQQYQTMKGQHEQLINDFKMLLKDEKDIQTTVIHKNEIKAAAAGAAQEAIISHSTKVKMLEEQLQYQKITSDSNIAALKDEVQRAQGALEVSQQRQYSTPPQAPAQAPSQTLASTRQRTPSPTPQVKPLPRPNPSPAPVLAPSSLPLRHTQPEIPPQESLQLVPELSTAPATAPAAKKKGFFKRLLPARAKNKAGDSDSPTPAQGEPDAPPAPQQKKGKKEKKKSKHEERDTDSSEDDPPTQQDEKGAKKSWKSRLFSKEKQAKPQKEANTIDGKYVLKLGEDACLRCVRTLTESLNTQLNLDGVWCYNFLGPNGVAVSSVEKRDVLQNICEGNPRLGPERLNEKHAAALMELCKYYNGVGIMPQYVCKKVVKQKGVVKRAGWEKHLSEANVIAARLVCNHLCDALAPVPAKGTWERIAKQYAEALFGTSDEGKLRYLTIFVTSLLSEKVPVPAPGLAGTAAPPVVAQSHSAGPTPTTAPAPVPRENSSDSDTSEEPTRHVPTGMSDYQLGHRGGAGSGVVST